MDASKRKSEDKNDRKFKTVTKAEFLRDFGPLIEYNGHTDGASTLSKLPKYPLIVKEFNAL